MTEVIETWVRYVCRASCHEGRPSTCTCSWRYSGSQPSCITTRGLLSQPGARHDGALVDRWVARGGSQRQLCVGLLHHLRVRAERLSETRCGCAPCRAPLAACCKSLSPHGFSMSFSRAFACIGGGVHGGRPSWPDVRSFCVGDSRPRGCAPKPSRAVWFHAFLVVSRGLQCRLRQEERDRNHQALWREPSNTSPVHASASLDHPAWNSQPRSGHPRRRRRGYSRMLKSWRRQLQRQPQRPRDKCGRWRHTSAVEARSQCSTCTP